MRVLVCGGRDFEDRALLQRILDYLHATRGPIVQIFPAQWDKNGKKAGPLRNQQMLDEGKPDLVVAFPGGRGTADMVRRARAAQVEVIEIAAAPPIGKAAS